MPPLPIYHWCQWDRWQSTTPAVDLLPVSMVVHLELKIFPQIFKQIWKGPNGILKGLGEKLFMKKTWSQKSRGTVPLNFLLHVKNCTKWKPQIHAVIPCQLETIHIPWLNLLKCPRPPPPHTHTSDVSIFWEWRGRDFTHNTAEMFSFGPSPTRAKKAWSSSTCLLYESLAWIIIFASPKLNSC